MFKIKRYTITRKLQAIGAREALRLSGHSRVQVSNREVLAPQGCDLGKGTFTLHKTGTRPSTKSWYRHDMAENLLTVTFNLNPNKQNQVEPNF